MTIEDTWVEGCGYNNSAFKALLENWSKLILNRMLGVPYTHKGIGQRWVDNHGCERPGTPYPSPAALKARPRLIAWLCHSACRLHGTQQPLWRGGRGHDHPAQFRIFPMLPVQPVRRRRGLPALAQWHLLADTAQRGPIPADGLGKRRDDRAHRGELWPLHCQA